MSSFSMDDFVGNGSLKEFLPVLMEEGWDDVPTLKIMEPVDMEEINMTRRQKVVLEDFESRYILSAALCTTLQDALDIRTYLHDRALTQYGDKLEASGKSLPELLKLSPLELSSQHGMKRGHIARFLDRTTSVADPLPESLIVQHIRRPTIPVKTGSEPSYTKLFVTSKATNDNSVRKSILNVENGKTFKGIVAALPAEPRACGLVSPPPVIEELAPYSTIENISVQKVAPEYKTGMELLVKTKAPPMKASELWRYKPAVLLCIRRPGCIMCRAEAHKLYAAKPIFDALGVKLFAVLHEHIEPEVTEFWPRYWGGAVIYDRGMEFFKALGGGKLLKDKFISGFIFNPRAIANYKRAKTMNLEQNFKGEGEIKGGLFILGSGKSGIAYQFIETNFGDWAPLSEVIEICSKIGAQTEDHQKSNTDIDHTSFLS